MTSLRASELAGDRIKQIRQRRGWTAGQLAERCKEIGAPEITVSVIANIETGRKDKDGLRRRDVTVDELFAFAYALEVPPVLLTVPLDGADQLQVTPEVEMDCARPPSPGCQGQTGSGTSSATRLRHSGARI